MTVPMTGCHTAFLPSKEMPGSSNGYIASNKLESHRRSPTCKGKCVQRRAGWVSVHPQLWRLWGLLEVLWASPLSLCCLLCNVSKLHACQHGDRPGFRVHHHCRAWLNTCHLPKVSGQNLIRALISSKTVYRKTVYNFFNIYVVLVFLYPTLLCLN